MTGILIYLLESSLILAAFYALYYLFLRNLTFFNANRILLLLIPPVALVIPLMSFESTANSPVFAERPLKEINSVRSNYYTALDEWTRPNNAETEPSQDLRPSVSIREVFPQILLGIYLIGAIGLIFRLFWSVTGIYKLLQVGDIEIIKGVKVVKMPFPLAPFSFLQYIFIHFNEENHDSNTQIIEHERTHINERHSIDLIFVQLLAAIFWFNPIIWLLIKSLKTTHEYIADRKMLQKGYSAVEYQALLLRQLISNNSLGLVHNFNLSFIKKRITMMKNNNSGKSGIVKISAATLGLVLLSLLIVQCNSMLEDAASGELSESTEVRLNLPVLPETGFKFDGNKEDLANLEIVDNKIYLNGKATVLEELGQALIRSGLTNRGAVVFSVDQNQKMSLIRDVQMELRKVDRRKLLYVGKTSDGTKVEMAFLLPPDPDSEMGQNMPVIDEKFIAEREMELLYLNVGDNLGAENKSSVYNFVMDQYQRGRTNYIVSVKYGDNDTFGVYLTNLTYIQEGFNQIYQERAKEMFQKDFYELENEDYQAVRQGIPRAISVAED